MLRVGNDNMMHWRVLNIATPDITEGQAGVVLVHPLVRLLRQSQLSAVRSPAAGTNEARVELPQNWCGCRQRSGDAVKR